ncbi:MAG: T9SS type A sorting domain-containing protein [Bacteroidetes bacterium]|nr:T9SS type A sorting domain-containing protein [Bacteroidota bacterium]
MVKDAAECIGTLACVTVCGVTIVEPPIITFSLSQASASCNGASDGEIDVMTAIGGIGTLTYSIDGVNYQSGSTFTGLASGLYTVYVKDVASCVTTDTITVVQPDPIQATIDSYTNLSCNLSQDGTLSISATGGDGNYLYSIDGVNFYPTGDFNSLAAGTYTVYVKDGNNCTGTTTLTITFTQPTAITANITTGNSTCGNANGTLLAIANGGSGLGYSYSIDGGATSNGTGAFSGLVDSTYIVLITDGNGCQNVFTAIVTDSDGPVIASSTFTDVTCNGGDDGTITITSVTGGTGTIIYSVDGGAFQLSNQITGLAAGQHTVVVRDANGCTGEISVDLTEPSAFTIVLTSNNIGCYGNNTGSITVNAAGGAGTLAYSIDGINFQSPNTFNNLAAGTYYVTVRDAGGCTDSETTTITQPSAIVLSIGTLNVDCNGNNSGAIYASATGGSGAIQYSINGITYQNSGIFSNIPAGNYTVFAKDSNTCIKTFNTVISQPNALVLSATITDVSCAGGDDGVIDLAITGGTPPYKFTWPEGKVSEDIFNLPAGIYTVYVTDANGCSVTGVYTVNQPLFPVITNGVVINATSSSSANGSIDATVNGGTPPYSYQWNHGPISEDISGLLPGVYVLVVTDAEGCTFTTAFVVEFSVGLTELSDGNELRIYPNPAKDLINVDLGTDVFASRISLVNITGQVIYEANPNSNKFEVNVKLFDKGLYFINIYTENEIITKKVVINR